MKKATLLALALTLTLYCGGAPAEETTGGTLHRATLREWHHATAANQYATAADIVEKVLNINDHLSSAPQAREVQGCINRVSTNFALRSQLVFDAAIACMAELGYLARR
jgi:hypothetical protein